MPTTRNYHFVNGVGFAEDRNLHFNIDKASVGWSIDEDDLRVAGNSGWTTDGFTEWISKFISTEYVNNVRQASSVERTELELSFDDAMGFEREKK